MAFRSGPSLRRGGLVGVGLRRGVGLEFVDLLVAVGLRRGVFHAVRALVLEVIAQAEEANERQRQKDLDAHPADQKGDDDIPRELDPQGT